MEPHGALAVGHARSEPSRPMQKLARHSRAALPDNCPQRCSYAGLFGAELRRLRCGSIAASKSASLSALGLAEPLAVPDAGVGAREPAALNSFVDRKGFSVLRDSLASVRSSTCWMLFRLAATRPSSAPDAAARTAGAGTFSMEATPAALGDGGTAGVGSEACAVFPPCMSASSENATETDAGCGEAGDCVAAGLTPKYTATAPSASTATNSTRLTGAPSSARDARRGAPSMVAKMLGPKSGCRDRGARAAPNSSGRAPRWKAVFSGCVMALASGRLGESTRRAPKARAKCAGDSRERGLHDYALMGVPRSLPATK